MKRLMFASLACAATLTAGTLHFDQPTREIHAKADATTVGTDFSFKNETASDVVIRDFKVGCSCITATIKNGKMAYKPGESGAIHLDFDMSKISSTVSRPVSVWLEGDPVNKPSIVLSARVVVPVLIEMAPRSLAWDVGGKPEPKVVTLTMKHTDPIRVRSISGGDPRFKLELKTIEEGKMYEVVVTPGATDQGVTGVIHIETDSSVPRHRMERVFVVVRQRLVRPMVKRVTKP